MYKTCLIVGVFLIICLAMPNKKALAKWQSKQQHVALVDTPATINATVMARHLAIEKKYLKSARASIEKIRKGDMNLFFTDESGKPLPHIAVVVNQISQDFLFGNLCEDIFKGDMSATDSVKFANRFKALFNFTEINLKWTYYERKQGKTEWGKLQQKLDWCKFNNITPKGHTLGWTNMSGTPPWLLKLPPVTTTELYKARIYNMVGGFKDQIKMWDVVNEPVTTIPWEKAMQDTVFGASEIAEGSRYNVKGVVLSDVVPWVERSYRWAYDANPHGDFILNEFYLIAKPEVREEFYQLVKRLQQDGVPLNGIGIQAHEPREMWFSPVEIVNTFNKYRDLGLKLHITEFIPQSSGKKITGGWRQGVWTEEAQAEFAEQFYTFAFGDPSMASIHWWGLSDKNIWLQGGGLLDEHYEPKPVYNRLLKLIKTDWMTKNVKLHTNKMGQVNFRGFYGNYTATATNAAGETKTFGIHVSETGKKSYVLKW